MNTTVRKHAVLDILLRAFKFFLQQNNSSLIFVDYVVEDVTLSLLRDTIFFLRTNLRQNPFQLSI